MIILRQKYFSHGVEYMALNKLKGIKQAPGAKKFAKENAVAVEKLKRKFINGVIDIVNNPVGSIMKAGKTIASHPAEVVLALPITPGGAALIPAVGRIKPYRKIVDKIGKGIEKSNIYKNTQKWNLKLLKKPYKSR